MAKSNKVQLQDIAKLTGSNVSTVSSILNGFADKRRISKTLQTKVLNSARELGYRPNLLAQCLRSGKSRIIGLVLPDLASPVFSQMSRTIEHLASKNNYRIMSCNSGEEDSNPEMLVNSLINYQVDGLIIAPTTRMKTSLFRMLEHSGIPFVLADRYIPNLKTCQVTLDNFQLGFKPTEHLICQGLERIAVFITLPELNSMKDRLAGYEAAMKQYGKRIRPPFIRIIPHHNYEKAAREAIDNLLEWNPPVEGIVFTTNKIGLPALEQLYSRRISIPRNLKVVSMEATPYFSIMQPSISAMSMNVGELAERSFNCLLKLMKGEIKPSQPLIETVEVELIARESSGVLARAAV
jgi:LacI family transcriptional regulator